MDLYENMHNIQALSKTIRFELKPVGKTKENMSEHIKKGKETADKYQELKPIMDSYYRDFINKAFESVNISFSEYYDEFHKSDFNENKEKINNDYRKKLFELLKNTDNFDILFDSKFLKYAIKNEKATENLEILNHFNKFATYLGPYFQSRKNIISQEAISTSALYRAVDENLEIFCSNINAFNILKDKTPEIVESLYQELGAKLKYDINEYFDITKYNNFMTQAGIDEYNLILNGFSEGQSEKTSKKKGLKELKNEYFQKNKEKKTLSKKINFVKLKKQILGESKSFSFKFDEIENASQLFENLRNLKNTFDETFLNDCIELFKFEGFNESQYIFIASDVVQKISNTEFGDYSLLINKVKEIMFEENTVSGKLTKTDEKKILSKLGINEQGEISKIKYLPVQLVNYALKELDSVNNISEIFVSKLKDCETISNDLVKKFDEIIFGDPDLFDKHNEENLFIIKSYLDNLMTYNHLLKAFDAPVSYELDADFYFSLKNYLSESFDIVSCINKSRNYFTKKPSNKEKFKLHFNCSSLLTGWSKSKIGDYKGVIFKESENYYLGILINGNKIDFNKLKSSDDKMKLIEYYYMSGASKSIPHSTIRMKEVKKHFENSESNYLLQNENFDKPFVISYDDYKNYPEENEGITKFKKDYLKKTGDYEGYRKSLDKWIDFSKRFLANYSGVKMFDYSNLKPSSDYEYINDFYNDVNKQSYKLKFFNVSEKEVLNCVEKGDLLLFQIYNKDLSKFSTGKPNLHTIYFKSIFDEENIKNTIYKLDGGAEIFFRYRQIEDESKVVHFKGQKIIKKTYEEKDTIKHLPEETVVRLNSYINGVDVALSDEDKVYLKKLDEPKRLNNDIIKNKRYTVDKILFHLPITINFGSEGKKINEKINENLKNIKPTIMGIDRGERNLVYISIIDYNGKILHQESLNVIDGVDYHDKLDVLEKNRQVSRKTWTQISKIKDLKKGYLSAAVNKIVRLADKYKSIIVMENLNVGFKRGRMKFEKQVYQNFEKMLTDKLNFLIFKDRDKNEIGGALKGYQLTGPFKEKDSRNGIIFYVPAGFTSNIDPTTGFIRNIKLNSKLNIKNQKLVIENIDSIKYDAEKDLFLFKTDFNKFGSLKIFNLPKMKWDIYTYGERLIGNKNKMNKWELTKIDLTSEMKSILDSFNINYQDGKELKTLICEKEDLLKNIYFIFKSTTQIRNSNRETGDDYIISPILNRQNEFFDSRKSKGDLPLDADANGAYNIARKGLIQIKQFHDNEKFCAVSNDLWFKFCQEV